MKLLVLLVLCLTYFAVKGSSDVILPDDDTCNKECLLGFKEDVFCECKTTGIFAGDIEVKEGQLEIFNELFLGQSEGTRSKRAALKREFQQWPKQGDEVLIYYNFETQVGKIPSYAQKQKVKDAARQFRIKTCIRMQEVIGTPRGGYIKFGDYSARHPGTCISAIGYFGIEQTISIPSGHCNTVGLMEHEIMHALGFMHEHQRPDRDNYITINKENLKEGAYNMAFKKMRATHHDSFGSSYDFNSVMQYSSSLFSRNNSPTMVKRDGSTITANTAEFSEQDVFQINRKYRCTRTVSGTSLTGSATGQRLSTGQRPLSGQRPTSGQRPRVQQPNTAVRNGPSITSSCRDRIAIGFCRGKVSASQCNDHQSRTYCRRTCGHCAVAVQRSRPTSSLRTRNRCVDNIPSTCPAWKAEDRCRIANMRAQCKKTCGVCH